MLLEEGTWLGKGSWRITTDSSTVAFDATIELREVEQGYEVEVDVKTVTNYHHQFSVWIAPDETGTYNVILDGEFIDMEGCAKLDSTPHLSLLTDSDRPKDTLTVALFETREAYGVRGFYRRQADLYTFELAIRSKTEIVVEEESNVVQFRPRPRR
ncbi:MAG: hypothetical protein OXC80_01155 [Gammaproteobacteria bacterium]|nr:hypothetical protein [Gammaproteobacteria bacterium]